MCAASAANWVVPFDEGRATDKLLLGGKGANLAEMTYIGLPVPPGFVVTTEACRSYLAEGHVPDGLFDQVASALRDLEDRTGRRLGDPSAPLLLSVRSGAPFSMPGMMDTVLDLGATPDTAMGLAAMGDERFAWDATRRFLEMFGKVVLGVSEEAFNHNLEAAITAGGVADERGLSVEQLAEVADAHRKCIADAGQVLPEIMLPLIGTSQELKWGVELIHQVAAELREAGAADVAYTVATMIETPRARRCGRVPWHATWTPSPSGPTT